MASANADLAAEESTYRVVWVCMVRVYVCDGLINTYMILIDEQYNVYWSPHVAGGSDSKRISLVSRQYPVMTVISLSLSFHATYVHAQRPVVEACYRIHRLDTRLDTVKRGRRGGGGG